MMKSSLPTEIMPSISSFSRTNHIASHRRKQIGQRFLLLVSIMCYISFCVITFVDGWTTPPSLLHHHHHHQQQQQQAQHHRQRTGYLGESYRVSRLQQQCRNTLSTSSRTTIVAMSLSTTAMDESILQSYDDDDDDDINSDNSSASLENVDDDDDDDDDYEVVEYELLNEDDFLNSEWLIGTNWDHAKDKIEETWVRLISSDDKTQNVAVWGDTSNQGTWTFDVASQFLSISKSNLGGKKIWACTVEDNYYYLQGTVRGWTYWQPAAVLGQWQAKRLGVDPNEEDIGIAPWFENTSQ
jgi:hypothetical protein